MLDTAFANRFVPGTNLPGDAAGAAWTFLLPSLDVGRVLCVGAPAPAALRTVARTAREVVVWCPDKRGRDAVAEASRRAGWAHVSSTGDWPVSLAPFDLVCVLASGARDVVRVPGAVEDLVATVRADARIYVEGGGGAAGRLARRLHGNLDGARDRDVLELAVFPSRGELRAAIPVPFPEVRQHVLDRGMHRPEAPSGVVDRVTRRLSWGGAPPGSRRSRVGLVVGPASGHDPQLVPRYLRALSREQGVDLSRHRWGLSARGRSNSRKVVFLLFPPGGENPDLVVKMTREPGLNGRLENECRALSHLSELAFDGPGEVPETRFFGHHAGLAILGQRAITGAAFRQRTTGAPTCPHATQAISWLTELAERTAERDAPVSTRTGDVLGTMLERYIELFSPPRGEEELLVGQIARIREIAAVPRVFEHGDAGVWNVVVTSDGRVAYLDWEAAEPKGLPLWDLFYFVRSFAVSGSARARRRDPLAVFGGEFFADTPMSRMLGAALDEYCERVDMPRAAAGPLFLTGWVRRALKEATRLPADRLQTGHYVRLLRRCVAEWENPHLHRVLTG